MKRSAWNEFSIWVRKSWANAKGEVVCCSCNRVFNWKDVHAGHFVSGKHNATYFEENNVHPQCASCNSYYEGNKDGYAVFMLGRYGEETINNLNQKKYAEKKFKWEELRNIRDYYKNLHENIII